MLQRVTHITSVSGGSVLAAHLVLNWAKYCEAPTAKQIDPFEQATQRLVKLIESDVRNRILRRLPWYIVKRFLIWLFLVTIGRILREPAKKRLNRAVENCTSVHILRVILDDFFREKNLAQMSTAGAPKLAILATEVSRMTHAWFTSDGFDQPLASSPAGADLITVGLGVAASAAFPAIFPPVRLDGEKYLFDSHRSDRFITDAGVYDNLGISGFLGDPFPKTIPRVFVSDATATRDWASGASLNILTSLLRSVDIIQQRGADLQRDAVHLPLRDAWLGTAPPGIQTAGRFVLFDIAQDQIKERPMVPATIQRHLSYIRTDFDAFSACEGRELVHHGYSVAWNGLRELGVFPPDAEPRFDKWKADWPWPESNASLDSTIDKMTEGQRSRIRLFSWSDPFGVLNTCVLLLLLVSPWFIWHTATKVATRTTSEMRADAKAQESEKP